MRSARPDPDDLTTRARIRDAAITHIARHGIRSATVRGIAAEAGVSAGLVLHHFGSKDGLRGACDDHVAATFADEIARSTEHLSPADVMAQMSRSPGLAPATAYAARALLDGGDFARRFFQASVAGTERYLVAAAENGQIRPPEQLTATARMMVAFSFGTIVLARFLVPSESDLLDALQQARDELTLPAMELFTYGLFTDDSYLRAYRRLTESADATPAPAAADADHL